MQHAYFLPITVSICLGPELLSLSLWMALSLLGTKQALCPITYHNRCKIKRRGERSYIISGGEKLSQVEGSSSRWSRVVAGEPIDAGGREPDRSKVGGVEPERAGSQVERSEVERIDQSWREASRFGGIVAGRGEPR